MEYKIVYEIAKFQIPSEFFICLIMFVISGIFLVDYVMKIISGQNKIRYYIISMALVTMACIGIVLGISTLKYGGGEMRELAKLYYCGDYQVVEGEVQNLTSNEISQDYYVDNVRFHISRMDETIWDIEENGQQVRISYISQKEDSSFEYPQIVKLEMAKGRS